MTNFIGSAFKGIFTFIIVVALILVIVAGGYVISEINTMLGILTWVIGLIFIVLSFGLVSIFINIDTNLQKIINEGVFINKKKIYKSGGDNNTWICSKCGTENESYYQLCTNCNAEGDFDRIKTNEKVNLSEKNSDKNFSINDKWRCNKCETMNEAYLPVCKKCGEENIG
jgi:hypothetical protein